MKNRLWKVFLGLWVLLFVYLLIMNSGILGLQINYDSENHQALISDFWPRSNYIVKEGRVVLMKDSIYLDLRPLIEFQNLEIYIEMEGAEKIEAFIKENFDSEELLSVDLKNHKWTKISLSSLSKAGLLVLPLPLDLDALQIEKLKLKFNGARWLSYFSKN